MRPDRAYFGEKDFQQLELVEGLVHAFFLDTRIVRCPTLREPDGLAMSSRNRFLTPAEFDPHAPPSAARRGGGAVVSHVRGCGVVDLVLGKT